MRRRPTCACNPNYGLIVLAASYPIRRSISLQHKIILTITVAYFSYWKCLSFHEALLSIVKSFQPPLQDDLPNSKFPLFGEETFNGITSNHPGNRPLRKHHPHSYLSSRSQQTSYGHLPLPRVQHWVPVAQKNATVPR